MWAYYQAKSIKQHAFEMQKEKVEQELLAQKGKLSRDAQEKADKMLARYTKNVDRYEVEKTRSRRSRVACKGEEGGHCQGGQLRLRADLPADRHHAFVACGPDEEKGALVPRPRDDIRVAVLFPRCDFAVLLRESGTGFRVRVQGTGKPSGPLLRRDRVIRSLCHFLRCSFRRMIRRKDSSIRSGDLALLDEGEDRR